MSPLSHADGRDRPRAFDEAVPGRTAGLDDGAVGMAEAEARSAVIPELDIWRAAQVMVKRYGDGAATEAAMRADEFLDQGNQDAQRV